MPRLGHRALRCGDRIGVVFYIQQHQLLSPAKNARHQMHGLPIHFARTCRGCAIEYSYKKRQSFTDHHAFSCFTVHSRNLCHTHSSDENPSAVAQRRPRGGGIAAFKHSTTRMHPSWPRPTGNDRHMPASAKQTRYQAFALYLRGSKCFAVDRSRIFTLCSRYRRGPASALSVTV